MRKHYETIITIFFFACAFELYAQQVTQTEAINVAIRVMEHRGISALSRDIDTVYRLEKHGNTLVYEDYKAGTKIFAKGFCAATDPMDDSGCTWIVKMHAISFSTEI